MSAIKSNLLAATAIMTVGLGGISIASAQPVKVIAGFSILGDMVSQVGGEHVQVTTLVGPNGDAHVYAPTPADARATAEADLVVVNGRAFEGWIDRLVEASGYPGPVAIVSEGATTINTGEAHEDDAESSDVDLEASGDVDPHAWQSIENAVFYVKNIADALCGVDAEKCESFRANALAYTAELTALDARIKAQFGAIPEERRKVITSHDAFGYFEQAYDVEFLAPQGVSTESEASAADVAGLINQIREENVTALFVENIADPRLIEQIGRETGVRPGGALYSDALSGADGPAPTYVQMMRHNADTLLSAMQGS